MQKRDFEQYNMNYNKEELEQIIKDSIDELLKEQPMLFEQFHDINERTVSSELSSKIRNRIRYYHINCEYNRMTDEFGNQIPKRIGLNPDDIEPSRVFPDIIIHRQENSDNNLLVVEIKMSWKNDDRERDFRKLESFVNELRYKFGLYLELGEGGIIEMIWYTNN